jgi:hypothetical protein
MKNTLRWGKSIKQRDLRIEKKIHFEHSGKIREHKNVAWVKVSALTLRQSLRIKKLRRKICFRV